MNNNSPMAANNGGLLGGNAAGAIQILIRISRSLLSLAERETQALLQNDMMTFVILQDEKEILASRYAKASEEFRNRLEEFRSVDPALIKTLENLQIEIGDKTRRNNELVDRLGKRRARQNTQKTLLTVQELGQIKPLNFPASQLQQQQQGA